ncbi:MAG: glycosyltransferase family 39 protein [Candidatus Xenobia bacterium]
MNAVQGKIERGPTDLRAIAFFVLSRAGILLAAHPGVLRPEAGRYVAIAHYGYRSAVDYHVLPAWPCVIKLFSLLAGDEPMAALVACNLCFALALWFLLKLGRELVGEEAAVVGTAVCAFFPSSLVESLGGPDALLLFTLVAAHCFARQDKWPLAGLMGCIAALTRDVGLLLLIPLLVEYVVQKKGQWRDLAWLLMIPLGFALFELSAAHAGAAPQELFSLHRLEAGATQLATVLHQALPGGTASIASQLEALELLVLLVGVIAGFKLLAWGPRIHALVFAASLLLLPHAALLLFPVFFVFGTWLSNPTALAATIGLLGTLLGARTVLFLR